MLKNYFKTSFRSLLKNKIYSIINILGLAIGLGCFILVTAYGKKELSYDKNFSKSAVIYRITTSLDISGIPNHYPMSHFPAPMDMVEEYPEVKGGIRLYSPSILGGGTPKVKNAEVTNDDLNFAEERFFITDSTFFDFFDFDFKYGEPKEALKDPFTVVLTSETSKKYFGDTNPIGKTLLYNDSVNFKVTGVLQPVSFNTHLQFDFLANARSVIKNSIPAGIDLENWYMGLWYYCYIEVTPDADSKELERKLKDFVQRHYPPRYKDNNTVLTLQNVGDIHLKSADMVAADLSLNGNMEYIYILSIVAISVLLVACFNFVNLATSRYLSRAKEVGIRKAIGAERIQLIVQFISEATIITALAGLVAFLLVTLFVPSFNQLANATLTFQDVFSFASVGQALLLFIAVGLISGIYPAFVLSKFQAALVLKGIVQVSSSKFSVRKGLVVLQFAVSLILIIGTLIVLSQLEFLKNKSMGFDKEQMLFLPDSSQPIFQQYPTFKNELLASSLVNHVTHLSHDLGQQNLPFYPFKLEGKPEEQMLPILRTGFDFLETFDLEMAQGRYFDIKHPSDSNNAFVINESAARAFGWTDAVGKKITFGVNGSPDHEVIGVIKDFNYDPLRNPIGPLVINFSGAYGNIAVKLKAGEYTKAVTQIEKLWNDIYPDIPFTYYFLDEALTNTYKEEQRLAKIYTLFCGLAIFIACLGLFALASYTIEKRKKEIAVRKVMGASSGRIAGLVYRDFLMLIVIAFAAAAPLAFYLFNSWLNRFAYRVNINLWLFVISLVAILFISALTVGFQTLKASMLSPATVLKNE